MTRHNLRGNPFAVREAQMPLDEVVSEQATEAQRPLDHNTCATTGAEYYVFHAGMCLLVTESIRVR